MLGEPIEFTFELSNRRKEPVSFPGIFGVGEGFLHVQVSKDGKEFLGCDNEGWGLLDLIGAKTVVTSEQPAQSKSSVLWNYISQDEMQFRFKEPGVYYFRSLFSFTADDDQAATKLESKPIKIELKAPKGDDLIVWNKIKDDGNFAYFIHTKEIPIPTYKPEERARFVARVEQIMADHPHSFYAALLRPGIEKIRGQSAQPPTGYKVEIKVPKREFFVGDIVQAEVEIRNTSTKPLYLDDQSHIKIASAEGGEFLNYAGPMGKRCDCEVPPLKPGEKRQWQQTILWNLVPDVSHLSGHAARETLKERILTSYAFPKAGTYYLKGSVWGSEGGKNSVSLESKPIKIEIKAPKDNDLVAWDLINGDGYIAYFIQTKKPLFPEYKSSERAWFQNKVEQIMLNHPLSFYAKLLRPGIEAMRAASGQVPVGFELELKLPQTEFHVGEIIQAVANVKNISSKPITLTTEPFFVIAREEPTNFGIYSGPAVNKFQLDGVPIYATVKPGETWQKQESIFWNYVPNTSNLSEHAARSYTDGRLLTNFAFPEPGVYYIKARQGVADGKPGFIESAPVKIKIANISGDDLKVWNRMKSNPEIGHFLQSGEMHRGYKPPEAVSKFLSEVESIIAGYPRSKYAAALRPSMLKYQANEAERRRIEEKFRINQ